ncbi:MAG: DNA topoisomerase IV subunit A [Pseudomonadota bacterium]|nr:DNA topoisomerase IV subunit A [Pseudomonadota bacterium]
MNVTIKASESTGDIRDTRLADAIGERYLSYALSIIMSRSLPDVRDGLKPVHRRLLYAMRQLKLDPNQGFKKCARVIGDVIGKYHPHGDQSVYNALVRLAQEFSVRYPLVDGQGNFGNIDGDNPAAMRYTEARMTAFASAILEGIDEDAVDFRETYDGEDNEPIVMPSSIPNLLANGAEGIAVGMACSIPPHNLDELCTALIHLIKFPNATNGKLVSMVLGPDFPTGGILVEDRMVIEAAYKTGRGSFRIRARWHVEKLGRGQYQIVITEIPFQIQKSRMIEKIAELLIARKLPILEDIRDESAEDIRIILEPKNRTIDPDLLMEQMFKLTDLESRFSMNMNVLDADNTPKIMNLHGVLSAFLDHRHVVLLRRSKFRLEKINTRLEVLDGYLIAYLNLDEVIRIIREEDRAKPTLMEVFNLSENQAEAILNMRLRSLRKLEELEIKSEHESLIKDRAGLNKLIKSKDLRWKKISQQISELKKEFSGKIYPLHKRRTEIGSAPDIIDIPADAFIEKEPITIIFSEKGWIKAAKGHLDINAEIKYKDGDQGKYILHAETTDKILLFSTNGRFFTVSCDKLPGGRGFGEPVRLMIDLDNDRDIVGFFVYRPEVRYLLGSSSGRGFIVKSEDVIAQTKGGKQILNLKGDDEAAAVCLVDGDCIAIIGENRKLLLFSVDEVPEMTKGRGVIMQRYKDGGLSDIKTFNKEDGLSWKTGDKTRTETDLISWEGRRAQAGRLPPKGFSRSNRFS